VFHCTTGKDRTGVPVATHDGLVRMIYAWERGDHKLTERYELLYATALDRRGTSG
jgi:protein tyrosine/serine phosphatase